MKLAVTISDAGLAANVGGDVERRTAIITIPDETLPKILRDYLADKLLEDPSVRRYSYMTASFSIMVE